MILIMIYHDISFFSPYIYIPNKMAMSFLGEVYDKFHQTGCFPLATGYDDSLGFGGSECRKSTAASWEIRPKNGGNPLQGGAPVR